MDRGGWRVPVHGVTSESDMNEQLSNDDGSCGFSGPERGTAS